MSDLERFRQQECIRFAEWGLKEPQSGILTRVILEESGDLDDFIKALKMIREDSFYFLLPLLLRSGGLSYRAGLVIQRAILQACVRSGELDVRAFCDDLIAGLSAIPEE